MSICARYFVLQDAVYFSLRLELKVSYRSAGIRPASISEGFFLFTRATEATSAVIYFLYCLLGLNNPQETH